MREGWRSVCLGSLFEADNRRLGTVSDEPPVFSLSKHDGLLLASDYFDARVASADLRQYKVVPPGAWAYSNIHIDEGSIAWNARGELGVISPMYTTLRWRSADHDPGYFALLLRTPKMLAEYKARAQGTVNRRRSLRLAAFAAISVEVPPLAEQRRIVDLIQAVDVARASALAVQRQASALWHSWAEQVWTTTDEEVQLGSIGRVITGSTPSTTSPEYWYPEEVPFFGPGDLGDEPVLTESRRSVSRAGADAVRSIPAPAVAQVCVGFGTGKVAVLGVPGCTNQQMNALIGLDEVDAITVMAMLRSAGGQDRLRSIRGLTVTPVVKKSSWAVMRIRWPSRQARALLCGVVTDAARVADDARRTAEALRVLRAMLLGELLDGRHEISASYDRFLDGAA